MEEGETSFEQLLPIMPEGWGNKAKELGEQDIITGDRVYCGKQGIAYLLGRGAVSVPVWDQTGSGMYTALGQR
jgi:hypothetical protein